MTKAKKQKLVQVNQLEKDGNAIAAYAVLARKVIEDNDTEDAVKLMPPSMEDILRVFEGVVEQIEAIAFNE